jgi:hypothetical protein
MTTPAVILPASTALARTRLLAVLATVALNVVAVVIIALAHWWHWTTGLALNILDHSILLPYAIKYGDRRLLALMLFGLAAGFAELPTDAFLVLYTKTLNYHLIPGPFIWESPLFMPFAWEIVVVQFAVIGEALIGRYGLLAGALISGLIGAINIPFYEELARFTKWWEYRGCRAILHTPYYIIAGEFLILSIVPLLSRKAERTRPTRTIVLGAFMGATMFPCYVVLWWIIG